MRERSKSCFVPTKKRLGEIEDDAIREKFDRKIFEDIISQITNQIPEDDEIPFEERLCEINWRKIEVNELPHKEIKSFILSLIEKTRKYRVLSEILTNVVQIYNNEFHATKSDLKKVLNNLHLDVPELLRLKNITPFTKYFDSMKMTGLKYSEARKIYKNMNDDEKLSWILDFLGLSKGEKLNLEKYNLAKVFLSQNEMALINKYEQKPKQITPFHKFVSNYVKNVKGSGTELHHSEIFKQAIEAWNHLSENEKKKIEEEKVQLKVQYMEDLKKFIDSLPEDRKLENSLTKQANIKSSFEKATKKVGTKDTKKRKCSNDGTNCDNNVTKKIKTKLPVMDEKKKCVTKKTPQNEYCDEQNNIEEISLTNNVSKKLPKSASKSKQNKEENVNSINIKRSMQNESFFNNNNFNYNDKLLSSPLKKNKKHDGKNESKSNREIVQLASQPTFDLKKPPESLYKYYVIYIHKGAKNSAKNTFKELNKTEKAKLSEKHKKAQKKFLKKFTEYLNTLSVDEMKNIQMQNNSDEDDLSDITDSSLDKSDYESDE